MFLGEAVYYNNAKRYDFRSDFDNYKPRNTNFLKEKMCIRNGETYWIFEYEVTCKCGLTQVFYTRERDSLWFLLSWFSEGLKYLGKILNIVDSFIESELKFKSWIKIDHD